MQIKKRILDGRKTHAVCGLVDGPLFIWFDEEDEK
jgi:hypothetical protein